MPKFVQPLCLQEVPSCVKLCDCTFMQAFKSSRAPGLANRGLDKVLQKNDRHWRSQGLHGWSICPHRLPKMKKWRKFEEIWKIFRKMRKDWGNVLILPNQEWEAGWGPDGRWSLVPICYLFPSSSLKPKHAGLIENWNLEAYLACCTLTLDFSIKQITNASSS